MHLFDYLKHLIAARSLFSRKAFSSGREEKRGRAKGDYFSEIITFIAELQSKVKNLCSLLYSSSSKEDFCKILLSSDEAVCMAANPTLKGRLLSIFE